MSKEIISPSVLFVVFEQHNDQWFAKIPHAFGKDKHFLAPVSEELSLQFQPTQLISSDGKQKKLGIVCYPLREVAAPQPNDTKEQKDE